MVNGDIPPSLMVLFWSHPSERKSSTGMACSILWQLGELLDEATDVIPVFKNILNMVYGVVFRVPYLVIMSV